jgi:hypothetical protein
MKAAGGELYLAFDDQDVRWLEVTMHEAVAVKVGERVDDRDEHFAGFSGRERTLGKDLGENLFGIFCDRVDERPGIDLTSAAGNEADEMRVG